MSAAENLRLWVEALWSTDKRQAKEKLARRDIDGVFGYCCLGLGCEVMGLEGEVTTATEYAEYGEDGEGSEVEVAVLSFGGVTEMPPVAFHEWIGANPNPEDSTTFDSESADVLVDWPESLLDREGRTLRHVYDARGCSNLNDNLNLTFAQIGDVINYFGVR